MADFQIFDAGNVVLQSGLDGPACALPHDLLAAWNRIFLVKGAPGL